MRLIDVKTFIKEYGIRSLVCCFSGGKDSLAMTHFVMSKLQGFESPIEIYVVFIDTGVMLPCTLEYVSEVSKELGWSIRTLKPNPDFWTLAEKWGTPSIRRRWCCYALKLKPIFDFVKQLPQQRATALGIRRDESRARRKYPQILYRKEVPLWSYCPIIGWTEKDVLQYIEEHNLPMPPHYRMGLRETCMCGAFAHEKELMIMKARFPKLFMKFFELEKKFGSGGSAFFDRGKKLYAKDMAKQKTLEEFM